MQSHDRCNVSIKPRLWDLGIYFRDTLLVNGTLRLIPHFIPIILRPGAPLKRPPPSPTTDDATPESPNPQKKKNQAIEPPTSPTMGSPSEETLEQEEEELAKEEAAYKASKRMFKTRANTPLTPGVTCSTWLIDFTEAQQRYMDSDGRSKEYATVGAHVEMIAGRYGMTALKPCDHCIGAGETCRVYHSECYEWDLPGRSMKNHLGWRCERCRNSSHKFGSTSYFGGCNAQSED